MVGDETGRTTVGDLTWFGQNLIQNLISYNENNPEIFRFTHETWLFIQYKTSNSVTPYNFMSNEKH